MMDCQSPGIDREESKEEKKRKKKKPHFNAATGLGFLQGFCSLKMILSKKKNNLFLKCTQQVLNIASFISCVSLVATRQDNLATGQ